MYKSRQHYSVGHLVIKFLCLFPTNISIPTPKKQTTRMTQARERPSEHVAKSEGRVQGYRSNHQQHDWLWHLWWAGRLGQIGRTMWTRKSWVSRVVVMIQGCDMGGRRRVSVNERAGELKDKSLWRGVALILRSKRWNNSKFRNVHSVVMVGWSGVERNCIVGEKVKVSYWPPT